MTTSTVFAPSGDTVGELPSGLGSRVSGTRTAEIGDTNRRRGVATAVEPLAARVRFGDSVELL